MTHTDNNALSAQRARWLAARARMGMGSGPVVIARPESKDIVQTPIQRLTRPLDAANRKLAMQREAARREKEEHIRLKVEADARALIEARRTANQEIRAIVLATANHFGITSQEILSDRRVAAVSLPRQVAMYLAKELTSHSYPRIGMRFHRDHTTVLHACRRIESFLAKGNPVVTLAIAAIKDTLNGGDPENYWGA